MDTSAIISFLTSYGVTGIFGVIMTIVITQLVKIPIKKWASQKSSDSSVSTKVYTWVIKAIAFAVAMIFGFLGIWMANHFDIAVFGENTFPWAKVVIEGTAIWGLANSLYTTFEDAIEANTSVEISKLTDQNTEAIAKLKADAEKAQAEADAEAEQKKTEKETAKLAKEAEKQAKAEAKVQAKIQKAEAKKQAEIEALNAKLAKLTGTATEATGTEAPVMKSTH